MRCVTAEGAEPTSPRAAPGKKTFKYGKLVRKLVRQVSCVPCRCSWQVAPNDIAWFTSSHVCGILLVTASDPAAAPVVQSDGQEVPLKQLARQVRQHWAAAAAEHGSPPDATSMKAILRVKLERIDGVVLQGKQVVLSA